MSCTKNEKPPHSTFCPLHFFDEKMKLNQQHATNGGCNCNGNCVQQFLPKKPKYRKMNIKYAIRFSLR